MDHKQGGSWIFGKGDGDWGRVNFSLGWGRGGGGSDLTILLTLSKNSS